MTNLESKAVKIQGKSYVLVADRILFFNEQYPEGSITTELVSPLESDSIVIKATVRPDNGHRLFTGYSQAVKGQGYINKTSALENAETSAVGRALAMMGIGVIESVASADEVRKAVNVEQLAKDFGGEVVEDGYGNCSKCGAANKWSAKANKPYCGAMCWKAQ